MLAGGEFGGDFTLRADNLAEAGKLFAEGDDAGKQFVGGNAVKHAFLEMLDLLTEGFEGGFVGFDHRIENGVGETVRAPDDERGVFQDLVVLESQLARSIEFRLLRRKRRAFAVASA